MTKEIMVGANNINSVHGHKQSGNYNQKHVHDSLLRLLVTGQRWTNVLEASRSVVLRFPGRSSLPSRPAWNSNTADGPVIWVDNHKSVLVGHGGSCLSNRVGFSASVTEKSQHISVLMQIPFQTPHVVGRSLHLNTVLVLLSPSLPPLELLLGEQIRTRSEQHISMHGWHFFALINLNSILLQMAWGREWVLVPPRGKG